MPEIYNCELWEKTKILAQDRGLKMSPVCPVVNACTGEHCVFINPVQTDEQKLNKLRQEIKEYGETKV